MPGRAVTRIDDQFERLDAAGVDISQQMRDIGSQDGLLASAAALWLPADKLVGFGQAWMSLRPVSPLIGLSASPHQLHAVVVHRVMAGGDFNAAVHIQMEGGEIDFFGAGHADVDHVGTAIHQAFGQRQLEGFAGQAHIAAHHDAFARSGAGHRRGRCGRRCLH